MKTELLFSLINPVMSSIYVAALTALWFNRREDRYLLVLAAAFVLVVLSFSLQIPPVQSAYPVIARAYASLFSLASTALLCLAFCQRFEVRFPWQIVGATALIAYLTNLWFLLVQPDVIIRIYVMNASLGLIFLASAFKTFGRWRNGADICLFILMLCFALLCVVRPIFTVPLHNLGSNGELQLPTYWAIFAFTHAIISMLVVFAVTTAVAVDAMRELQKGAFTDPLSGLRNRRGFEDAVAEKLEWAQARKLPVSLILCDLDHFKSVNDTYGHHIGDQVISVFARVMREVVGDNHVVARIGGEEFAILVAGGDARLAEMIAHGVRVGFSSAPTPGRSIGAARRLTASFGVAQLLANETYEDMLGRADKALYAAKGAGRDCVRIAPVAIVAETPGAKARLALAR